MSTVLNTPGNLYVAPEERKRRQQMALIYALYEAADAICKADPHERELCEPLWARAAEIEQELGL